ncbi:MAG: AMP-binding protein [Solirubrobacterales bacterium]
MNAIEWLRQVPERNAEREFLLDSITGRVLTYEALHESACRIAADLNSRGLKRGNRLALVLNNSVEMAQVYFGCIYAGITVIPLNPVLSESDALFILTHCQADALITAAASMALISGEEIVTKLPQTVLFLTDEKTETPDWALPWHPDDLPGAPAFIPYEAMTPDDVIAIVYTSGTTSRPKGVAHRLSSFVENARSFCRRMGIDANNRFYAVLSMSYMGGFYNLLLLPFIAEASVVLAKAFDARAALSFWKTVRQYEVNTLWLVPTIMSILMELDRGRDGEKLCRETIRLVLVGTAPLTIKRRHDFEKRYGIRVYENYGLTELLFVTTNFPQQPSLDGCVGRVLPGVQLAVVDSNGLGVPYGEEGDILVATSQLMEGYYEGDCWRPAPELYPDGWFATGDAGILTANGDLFITGRKKDLIIRGGFNVSPAAIENVLMEHPEVAECAVVGVPHQHYGEDVAAVVRLRPGADFAKVKQEMMQIGKERLAATQRPFAIVEIEELPRTSNGKIRKDLVRELLIHKLGLTQLNTAASPGQPAGKRSSSLDLRRKVDLTLPIREGMVTYPRYWHPMVEITQLGRLVVEERETHRLVLGTHTGTHCDAPRHCLIEGGTLETLSLDVLIGKAFVFDFSFCQPGQQVEVKDLLAVIGEHCPERVLLRFDWSEHWGCKDYYTDQPYLSKEAAEWFVEHGVKLLGMDIASPDNPAGGSLDVHKTLLGANIILVEYLCNLKEIKGSEIDLIVAPLNIPGVDGSPVRCIALE